MLTEFTTLQIKILKKRKIVSTYKVGAHGMCYSFLTQPAIYSHVHTEFDFML